MLRNPKNVLYQVQLFDNVNISFKSLVENEIFLHYKYLIDAVMEGVIDPDLSIVDNMNAFIEESKTNDEIKSSRDFPRGLSSFYQLLNNLDMKNMAKFYGLGIIDFVLEKELIPYEQVDITRMYFMNPYKSDIEKKAFLHSKIKNIFDGNRDFRIINSLDKVALNPNFLSEDLLYNLMIEFLINKHLRDFDKYKEKNKKEREFDRYIIRMVYRHQNKGYYVPDDEYRNIIVNTYAYNGWFKELRFMIENNKLGINSDNYKQVIEEIKKGFDDMAIVCKFNCAKYIEMDDKFNEIITLVTQVVEEPLKLVRKDEE